MVGKGSIRHNNRDFTAENVDAERTKNNITYCNENIKDVYYKLFNEALVKFNARQTRKDRMIDDYYEKIRTGKHFKNAIRIYMYSRLICIWTNQHRIYI